jgi:hypothetical protein
MDEIPSVPISDFENTLSFPSVETSLGRGGFPHISSWEMCHAAWSPPHGFLHHIIGPLNTALPCFLSAKDSAIDMISVKDVEKMK